MTDQSSSSPAKAGADAVSKAAASAHGLRDQAKQAGSSALSDASGVVEDAKGRASSLVNEAGGQATTAIQHGKDGLAAQIDDMAQAVHRSGEQLEGHQDFMAQLIERGADELGSIANTLRSNDLQGLTSKLQDLSKRQPALFVGAAMAVGFAAVRFGKVTASGATRDDLPHAPEAFRGN